tara:strand:- start:38078 stop:39277 length:1200 start_codon:yes stop_codon:yes gene_type:complete
MSEIQKKIIIVGGGPAGSSTALHLSKLNPELIPDILLLEKATHPRTKVCSGALSHHGSLVLKGLGIQPDVPHIPLRDIRMAYGKHHYSFKGNPVARVFQRSELDQWLLEEVRKSGVEVRENEGVQQASIEEDGVTLHTDRAQYRAKMVVAADGASSPVRHALGWPINPNNKSRLLDFPSPPEASFPLKPAGVDANHEVSLHERGLAILYFSRISQGLQGYLWDIPTQHGGSLYVDRGLFDSRTFAHRPIVALKDELRPFLAQRNLDLDSQAQRLSSHPYHFFDPSNEFSRPHILLAGDAAGVDPLCGEGIAFALGYGRVAAKHLVRGFKNQDFSGKGYKQEILKDPVTKQLRMRFRLARMAYSIRSSAVLSAGWSIASFFARFTKWNNADYVPDNPGKS